MSTVYVVQMHRKRDPNTGEFVPVYDVTSALQFGEIVELVSPTAVPHNSRSIIEEMRERLQFFDGDEDYLLPMGSPALIGWACALAAEADSRGRVRTLLWSQRENKYVVIDAVLFPTEE